MKKLPLVNNEVVIYDVEPEEIIINNSSEKKYKIFGVLLIIGIIFFIWFVANQPAAPSCSGIM